MSGRFARGLALVVLAASFAPACSRTHAPGAPSEAISAQGTGPTGVLPSASLIDRVQTAAANVRHGGTRRITYDYAFAGARHALVYEERITTDGHGRFAIDPLRVGQPAMTADQSDLFKLVQKQREGFFQRYRDFGVRQRALFLENYRVVDLKTHPVIAGRDCEEFEIERLVTAQSTYRVAIDRDTALVLRCIELAPDGSEIARLEYTEFTLAPVLDGVDWFTAPYEGVPLDAATLDAASFGAVPARPKLLPQGFQFLHAELLREDGVPWIRRVYGDGVETLFLLQRGARATIDAQGDGAAHLTRVPQGGDVDLAPPATPPTYTVRVFTFGPWTAAEVSRGTEQIFVVGKLPEGEIVRVLQSSF